MTSGYEQQPFDIRRPSLEIQVGPWIVLWGGKMLDTVPNVLGF